MFLKIQYLFALSADKKQSLMMAFGMVVIAGLAGSGGLGETSYGAIGTLDIATSINGTIAIVVLTLMIGRIIQNALGNGR
jgi:glycine betaine/proline transport system permease protein